MIHALLIVALLAPPAPRLPPYVAPADLADNLGLPPGPDPEERDGGIWYAPETHQRLATLIAAVEPLSDTRAELAWAYGYADGRLESAAQIAEAEKRAHDAESTGGWWAWGAVGMSLGFIGASVFMLVAP